MSVVPALKRLRPGESRDRGQPRPHSWESAWKIKIDTRLANRKPWLYTSVVTAARLACCVLCTNTDGKSVVKSHVVIYRRWHNEPTGKKNQISLSQPNSLPNSQLNLAALLLCYKTDNCLWVHSRAHYCFNITSKNLRRVKIEPYWSQKFCISSPHGILDWGSFWGMGLFSHINYLRQVYLYIQAGWLWLPASGNFKIGLLIQEPFTGLSHHLLQDLRSYKMSQCADAFSSRYSVLSVSQGTPDGTRRSLGQSISESGLRTTETWSNLDDI